MSREAMKLALEALEYIHEGANNQGPHTGISWRCVSNKAESAITALREALAEQPAQQAVGHVIVKTHSAGNIVDFEFDFDAAEQLSEGKHTVYTSPPAQQEPFGYFKAMPFGWTDCAETDEGAVALYQHPPAQRKPLTDQEIVDLCDGTLTTWEQVRIARAVEAAHSIKEKS